MLGWRWVAKWLPTWAVVTYNGAREDADENMVHPGVIWGLHIAMIRFEVFKRGELVAHMPLTGSYLFAQDEIPVRSQLTFTDGELMGVRHSDTAVGLATLWEVDRFGKVMLQTTRLPERKEAYNLNVELARGRLLRIAQKREEWGMVDLILADTQRELVDGALDRFIDALCHLDEPAKGSELADESLEMSLRAGEAMSLAHARMFLERRGSTQGFGRHSFGCCLDPNRIRDQVYMQYIKDNFHFVTIPIGWKQIEPKEQEQSFDALDECVNWLYRNRIAVKVGPLLSFSPSGVPDWLYIWENDFEQLREMAYDFITTVVERYGNKVQAWDVISGLNAENCFKFAFDEIIEMTRSAALAAKRASHRSLVVIELTEPWGSYYALNQRTIPPLIYADMVCQSGVNFDGLGVKLRFGRGAAGMQMKDMLELSCLLDRFGAFGKPVHLSSVQAPSVPDTRDGTGLIGEAGSWHSEWDENAQAQWLEQVYQIALSKPYVETVTWQDLADRGDEGVLQFGGILNARLEPKPAFERMCRLKNEMVKPPRSRTERP